MNQLYQQLTPYLERSMALEAALILFDWDMATLAPEKGAEKTGTMIGILSDEYFKNTTDKTVVELVKKLKDAQDLNEVEAAVVRELWERIERLEGIPSEEYREYSELKAKARGVWEKAREADDYQLFAPVLEKIIGFEKKFAAYQKKDGQNIYDILLDRYEKGFGVKTLDVFFDRLKKELMPVVKQVIAHNDRVDNSFLKKSFDIETQKKVARFIAEYVGFDFEKGVLAESAHPFTTNLHNEDVRITTNYEKHNLEGALFSVIHEAGHGIYELGIRNDLTQTPVGTGASMGIHESQSRFYENMIGRSEAFWKPIYKQLVEAFPSQLTNVSLHQFVQAVNRVEPGLIRIKADELTYCFHIMVRYEMEKLIMEEDVDIAKLPEIWNDKYEEYLGIRPKDDASGILQDVHWSQGDFGYFPSYALGSAFAAQIWHTMEKEISINKELEAGNLKVIKAYLGNHIHQYGKLKPARQLLEEATGEEFNPQYYIDYLKNKYKQIYEL